METYPDRIILQQRISRRISQRLAIMDMWTPLLPVSVLAVVGYLLFVGEFFLGLAKPWLISQSGFLGYLGAKYDRILILLGIGSVVFFAMIATFPYVMRLADTLGRRHTRTDDLAQISGTSSSNETGGRLEGDTSMTSDTAEPIAASPRLKEDNPDSDVRETPSAHGRKAQGSGAR